MPESASESAFVQAERAAAFIRERTALRPQTAIVLGTGLGGFADRLTGQVAIPYSEIPHFPRPTVEGHAGRLVLGSFAGTPLAVMQGRVHAYAGYTPGEVLSPPRGLARLGIETLIVTNAAGAIRTDLAPGQLVLISDHINFTGNHPPAGQKAPPFGGPFSDMPAAYSRRPRHLAHRAATAEGIPLSEGVYLGLTGP